jgi:hypothetical protein
MTKYDGVSQLADVSRDLTQPRNACYPVKKRFESRRLNPNWDAIRWLEDVTASLTEITHSDPMRGDDGDNLDVLRTPGGDTRLYSRPMIQVIPRDAFSGAALSVTPCMACYRFDRSWACADHPEVPYNHERKQWARPGLVPPTAYVSAPMDPSTLARQVAAFAQTGEVPQIRCVCGCQDPEPPDGRGYFSSAEQEAERVRQTRQGQGYWVDPDDPGLGLIEPLPFPPQPGQVWNNQSMRWERPPRPPGTIWNAQRGVYERIRWAGASPEDDRGIDLNRYTYNPNREGPFSRDSLRRVAGLQDGTIEVSGTFTLHVEGSDAQSFEIEVRPNDENSST